MLKNHRFRLFVAVTTVLALGAAFWTLNRRESDAAVQTTDDAYVQADFTVIAPQVAGRIARVRVQDNQPVRAGQPLLDIDDRDLVIALADARAQVAVAQATVDGLQAQRVRQQSVIAQARSAVAADQASLGLAEANRIRYANLAQDGSGTVQARQQAESQVAIQHAARARDQAGLQAAEAQVAILQADLAKARAGQLAARARVEAADLNLSYAHLSAPVDGVVAQRSARTGSYVRVGEALLTLVPVDAVYVEANFRETQLARVRVGQSVSLTVDALPGVQLKGRVDSLGPASGVSFSAVPPHNATGNFTKIVQRLPVRIRFEPGQEAVARLRIGMSVRPGIDVGT